VVFILEISFLDAIFTLKIKKIFSLCNLNVSEPLNFTGYFDRRMKMSNEKVVGNE